MGLSLKKSGKQEEAMAAFRRALQVSLISSKERVQILYLLERTVEALDRILKRWRSIDGSAEKRRSIEMSRCESNR